MEIRGKVIKLRRGWGYEIDYCFEFPKQHTFSCVGRLVGGFEG
jgi:hypothetical protein